MSFLHKIKCDNCGVVSDTKNKSMSGLPDGWHSGGNFGTDLCEECSNAIMAAMALRRETKVS